MSRYLADTHIVLRWLSAPRRLSSEQRRVLRESARRGETVGISATSLLEIATKFADRKAQQILSQIEVEPTFAIYPLTHAVACDVAALRAALRDPIDCTIVATARVHGLKLITSDQRIIESRLVPVID